ncbi:MAG: hypothetical protein AMXMBFR58_15460 [Phycisphaerae bacterium]
MPPPDQQIPPTTTSVAPAPIPPSRRLLDAPWINRAKTAAIFTADPWNGLWGRRPTYWAACLWCFCVTWPVSIVELAGIPLMLCTALRIHRNWRYIPSILLQPLLLTVALFGIIQFTSGLWTIDRAQWLEQSGSIRWLWSLFMLWPLIEHRRSLILWLAAGALVGNATQLSQFLHTALGWPTPTWPRAPDRTSGWWPPVVCGTLLTAILGLHLPALVLPCRPREKILATIAAPITLAGILASGTRGAWLASAALLLVSIPLLLVIRARSSARPSPASPRTRLFVVTGAILALLAASLIWWKLGDSLLRRADLARQEITAAIHTSNYTTDTGARIGMALWAIDLFRDHPFAGVGAGSFRPATQTLLQSRGIDPSTQAVHQHAHNALLHIAATTGLLGLLPALAVILIALRNAAHLARDRVPSHGPYEWGPFVALLGLLFVSAFDAVHINAQTSALLAVLLSLSPTFIPTTPNGPPPIAATRPPA